MLIRIKLFNVAGDDLTNLVLFGGQFTYGPVAPKHYPFNTKGLYNDIKIRVEVFLRDLPQLQALKVYKTPSRLLRAL